MVKVPNRPPTPIHPHGPGGPPPTHGCPVLTVKVDSPKGQPLRREELLDVQVRQNRVRFLRLGQIVAWIDDAATAARVSECHRAGSQYRARVDVVIGKKTVLTLETAL